MPRFYISDGNRPGRRSPSSDYATKPPGVGSSVLNEVQAVMRGRITQPDNVNSARFVRIAFNAFTGAARDDINPFRIRVVTSAEVNVSQGKAAVLSGPNIAGGSPRYEATDDTVANVAYGSNFWYPADAAVGRYLTIDLGAIYSVDRVEMGSWSDAGINRFIDVSFSVDGLTYDLVTTTYSHNGAGIKVLYQYAPTAASGGGPEVLLTPNTLTGPDANVIKGAEYYPAWQVFDGNTATTWFAYGGVDDTWIGYDFGLTPKSVTKFRIHGNGSWWGGVGATWELQSSSNGSTWATVTTLENASYGWNEKAAFGNPAAARYWRVKRTNGSSTALANTEVGALELWGN